MWRGWRRNWKTELIESQLRARPGLFVDVGANWGQTMLDHLAASPEGRYLGFEPNAECAAFLQHMIELNGLNRCEVVPAAIGVAAGVVELQLPVAEASMSLATLVPDFRPDLAVRPRHVVCLPGDVALAGQGPISLIKVDVEGAELSVLQGLRSTIHEHRPSVLCEILLADARADHDVHAARVRGIEQLLAEEGYLIQRVDRRQGALQGLTTVESLPTGTWSQAESDRGDYLLTPTDRA